MAQRLLSPFELEFANTAGEFAMKLSFSRSVGQIYAVLYIHPQPLSLDEIAELLQMSKGNVSINLRTLEGWGAIQKAWVPGSRRVHFSAERDLTRLAFKRIQEGVGSRLEWAKVRIDQLEKNIDLKQSVGENGAGSQDYVAKLQEFRAFIQNVDRLLVHLPKLRFLLRSPSKK